MLSSGELLKPPLKIGFGDVFTVNPNKKLGRRPERVVIGLDNDYCVSTDLYLAGTGKEALEPTGIGTTGRIHIEEVVGYWDLTRMLEALKAGYFDRQWEELWYRLEARIKSRLEAESQKPHILLGRSVPQL